MAKPSLTIEGAGVQITREEYSWATSLASPISVTYAYRDTTAGYHGQPEKGTFSRFSDKQIGATELILDLYADVANIDFVRVNPAGYSDSATMLFANYRDPDDGTAAFAYLPSPLGGRRGAGSVEGDLWYNLGTSGGRPKAGDYDFQTLLHEIGHTLGLDHPGDYDQAEVTYRRSAEYRQDSLQYTNMSYFDAFETGADHVFRGETIYAQTLLLHDIAAIQRLYGANTTTRTGDTVYGFNATADRAVFKLTDSSDQFVVCIYDCGGTDTLDFSVYAASQRISLAEGTFSNVGALTKNVSIAAGSVIENAIGGSGDDRLTGNAVANTLTGGRGDDVLIGRQGNDTLISGPGFDILRFASPLGAGNIDTIVGFNALKDTIELDRDIFAALSRLGTLSDARFALVGETLDASDRIIFDQGTGAVSYDADGSGATPAVQFAVAAGADLDAASFFVIA